MKKLILLILIVGCASKPEKQIISEASKLPVLTYSAKKEKIKAILAKHPEFDAKLQAKIETVLLDSLNKSQILRKRESQLIQQISNYTIVEKGEYGDLLALKKEFRELYDMKYKNLSGTITELKKLIGIKQDNHSFMQDLGSIQYFSRN